MSDVSLPSTIDPPTVSTAEVQGNFEALRDFVNGDGWVDMSKLADNSLTEAKNIAGSTGLTKGSFSAYRAAALSLSSDGVLVCDTEEWDVSGWHNTANGRFTPQLAGTYRLSGQISALNALAADKQWMAKISKNGVTAKLFVGNYQRGTQPVNSGGSALVQANGTTDYFELRIIHDVGAAAAVWAAIDRSYFQGELVGRS